MKPLGIHRSLHQLAVPLLHLNPRLFGSSAGLLFPCIVWVRPFSFSNSTTVLLTFILTADRFGQ